MRQFRTWAMRGIELACCLAALSGCSDAHKNGMAPPGDFNNPDPILSGGKAGSSGTGTGTGAAGSTNPNRCVTGRANTTRVQPRVILVLDGSCSMSTDYPANGMQSASSCVANPKGRWAALRSAMIDPQNGVVPKLQNIVQFGMVVFGTTPTCPTPIKPISPALNNLPTIQSTIPMVQPGMYTPTGPALDYVYKNMIVASSPDGNLGPQIVILATDGEPNSCGGAGRGGQVTTDYQPAIDAVKYGVTVGATTYIVSLADSAGTFHDHLQDLANLGDPAANGAAKLYTPGSPQELEDALAELVGGAVGCDIALNGTIATGSECKGTVTLDGAAIGCNDPNGWKLVDPQHIRLQGTACQKLMANNGAVDATFPCDSFSPG
jgi:hypothetical protein